MPLPDKPDTQRGRRVAARGRDISDGLRWSGHHFRDCHALRQQHEIIHPPPDKEEIKWLSILGDTKQYRFVTFRQIIPFGRLAESPELDCYRVTMELTEEKERYEKLLFNSGLFLGLGVSLMLSGIYEAIKYEKDRKRSN